MLDALSQHPEGCTLTSLSIETGISKSTLSPIMRTLENRHFASLDPATGAYSVGLKCFAVGSTFMTGQPLISLLRMKMELMVEECQETCQLGVLDDDKVFYLAKVDSPQAIRLISSIGTHIPAYCTALGKALLSDSNEDDIRTLYPNGLNPMTAHTLRSVDELFDQIAEQKAQGVFQEHEESSDNVVCYSVPLRHRGRIVAAVSISVPKFRLSPEKESSVLHVLTSYKKKLEILLDTYQEGNSLLLG